MMSQKANKGWALGKLTGSVDDLPGWFDYLAERSWALRLLLASESNCSSAENINETPTSDRNIDL